MKQTFRLLGILAITLAVIFFLYGSVKMSRAEDQENPTFNLGDDITLVEEAPATKFADKGFAFAGILFVAGLGLTALGGRVGK